MFVVKENNYEEICCICKKPVGNGLSFHKRSGEVTFKYLEIGECAHLECYIDNAVEKKIEEIWDMNRNADE